MTGRAKKYLFDIDYSIDCITGFLESTPTFDLYKADLKTKSAVERHLGIIGEAVNKLLREDPTLELTSSSEIISFRNRLIHAYDSIDDAIVWAIKTNHLPVLKREILQLLNP